MHEMCSILALDSIRHKTTIINIAVIFCKIQINTVGRLNESKEYIN